MSLGTRLKKARLAKNYSQKQLGEMVGVTGSSIGNYENGYSAPLEDVLIRLMSALGVDANYLYADDMAELSDMHFLAPVEEQLLTLFRSLNADGQNTLLTTAESFALNPAFKQDGIDKAI